MNKAAFIAFLIAATAAYQGDYKVCTEDSKVLVDDIFVLIEDLEKDPLNPPAKDFKSLLADLEKLLLECANIHVDFKKYDKCVDDLVMALPQIKKLVDDIKKGDNTAVIVDATTLALQLMNGFQKCAKATTKPVAFSF